MKLSLLPLALSSALALPLLGQDSAQHSADDLSVKATDPTASLMAFNFQTTYIGGYHGPSGGLPDDSWSAQFRPVIPWNLGDLPNILRMTVPYQLDGRGQEGFGPISVFDLGVINEDWGRWGFGPVMSFDTTGDLPDEFVIGPAVGFVWQARKRLKLGLFSQNVFWSHTAQSQIQPVIAYQLGHGWAVSAGDLQITYDWEASRWRNIPVGFQLGKVTKIAGLPCRLAVNPQYNLKNDPGLPEWQLTFTFTALFPSF